MKKILFHAALALAVGASPLSAAPLISNINEWYSVYSLDSQTSLSSKTETAWAESGTLRTAAAIYNTAYMQRSEGTSSYLYFARNNTTASRTGNFEDRDSYGIVSAGTVYNYLQSTLYGNYLRLDKVYFQQNGVYAYDNGDYDDILWFYDGNSHTALYAAGAIFNESGEIRLSNSYFMGNAGYARSHGEDGDASSQSIIVSGAILNLGGSATITDCIFEGNASDVTIQDGSGVSVSSAGAIYNSGALTITDSSFRKNVGYNDALHGKYGASIFSVSDVSINVSKDVISTFSGFSTSTGVAGYSIFQSGGELVINNTGTLDMRDPFSASGFVTKNGSGTWKLGGASKGGYVRINAGTLHLYRAAEVLNPTAYSATAAVAAAAVTGSTFTLADGAKISIGGGNTLDFSTVNFGGGSYSGKNDYIFDMTGATTSKARLTVKATYMPYVGNGNFYINNADALGAGTYPLISLPNLAFSYWNKTDFYVDGVLNSNRVDKVRSITGAIKTYSINFVDHKYNFIVAGTPVVASLLWTGSANAVWASGTSDSNWKNTSTAFVANTFVNNDTVTFDDSSSRKTVEVASAGVTAKGVTITTSSNYVFNGGKITAETMSIGNGAITLNSPFAVSSSLTKNGTGTLNIAKSSTAATASINGGTLLLDSGVKFSGTGTLSLGDKVAIHVSGGNTLDFRTVDFGGGSSSGRNDYIFDMTGATTSTARLTVKTSDTLYGVGFGNFYVNNVSSLASGTYPLVTFTNLGTYFPADDFYVDGVLNSKRENVRSQAGTIDAYSIDSYYKLVVSRGNLVNTSLLWTGSANAVWASGTSDSNWKNMSTAFVANTFVNNDTVTFDDSSSRKTVEVASAGVTAKGVTIATGSEGYSFLGGRISAKTLAVSNAGTVTMIAPISLDTSLEKTGGGTLDLRGSNIANETTISEGTLKLTSARLSGSGTFSLANNAKISLLGENTLDFNTVLFGVRGTDAAGNSIYEKNSYIFDMTGATTSTARLTVKAASMPHVGGGEFYINNVSSLSEGTYPLISPLNPGYSYFPLKVPYIDGVLEPNREKARSTMGTIDAYSVTFSGGKYNLVVEKTPAVASLEWTGETNAVWANGTATKNWKSTENTLIANTFVNGDSVTFGGGVSRKNVEVASEGVRANAVTINGGSDGYVFNGGKITAERMAVSGGGKVSLKAPFTVNSTLTKNDAGTLSIGGDSTANNVFVNGGILHLEKATGNLSGSGTLTFADGAKISAGGGNTLNFETVNFASTTDYVFDMTGAVEGEPLLTINARDIRNIWWGRFNVNNVAAVEGGTYTLLQYNMETYGSVSSMRDFYVDGVLNSERGKVRVPAGTVDVYRIDPDYENGKYDFVITRTQETANVVWTGGANSTWGNKISDKNWKSEYGTYRLDDFASETFVNNDTVTFDDSATNKNVNVASAGVTAKSVTISNMAGTTYTFSGGKVTATDGFEKRGGGTLALSGEEYAGNFALREGTLRIGKNHGPDASLHTARIHGALTLYPRSALEFDLGTSTSDKLHVSSLALEGFSFSSDPVNVSLTVKKFGSYAILESDSMLPYDLLSRLSVKGDLLGAAVSFSKYDSYGSGVLYANVTRARIEGLHDGLDEFQGVLELDEIRSLAGSGKEAFTAASTLSFAAMTAMPIQAISEGISGTRGRLDSWRNSITRAPKVEASVAARPSAPKTLKTPNPEELVSVDDPEDEEAPVSSAPPPPVSRDWTPYVRAAGGKTSNGSGPSSPVFDITSYGGVVGLDRVFLADDSLLLGVNLGYNSGNASLHEGGKIKQTHMAASLYASKMFNKTWFVDAVAGGGMASHDTERELRAVGASYRGKSDGMSLFASLYGGGVFSLPHSLELVPYLGFEYINAKVDAFEESGVGASPSSYRLYVDGFSQNSFRAKIGAALQWNTDFWCPTRLGLGLSFSRELADSEVDIPGSLGTPFRRFNVRAAATAENLLEISPHAEFSFTERLSLSISLTYATDIKEQTTLSGNAAFVFRF
ncbi:MAG: autotransporter domain-containing protein [Puniceicoccales bacterium]|jgi:autotransporter-associated beta strand protein|nr:autotransporter domain-containing protein [Puniceicoccales bacterium]